MDLRSFCPKSTFTLIMEGDSNWDYYLEESPTSSKPIVVAFAKPDSGASDCFFGDIAHFCRVYGEDAIAALSSSRFDHIREHIPQKPRKSPRFQSE